MSTNAKKTKKRVEVITKTATKKTKTINKKDIESTKTPSATKKTVEVKKQPPMPASITIMYNYIQPPNTVAVLTPWRYEDIKDNFSQEASQRFVDAVKMACTPDHFEHAKQNMNGTLEALAATAISGKGASGTLSFVQSIMLFSAVIRCVNVDGWEPYEKFAVMRRIVNAEMSADGKYLYI